MCASLIDSVQQDDRKDLRHEQIRYRSDTFEFAAKWNEELSHRRCYIEVLLESVQSGVISLDENGRISMVNPAACRTFEARSRTKRLESRCTG